MQRFITVIALVFALATVGGATTSHSLAYSSVPMAISSDPACSEHITPVVVSFKVCGKKSSGIVMPCGQHIGLMSEVAALPALPNGDEHDALVTWASGSDPCETLLRPPRAA
ncbi:hypothetical protein [Devosia sp. 2618]|uniref:hypothetical protein n=1 Tax=Devosia sp. 2618 TaxID=3156454 RepID=UPI003399C925